MSSIDHQQRNDHGTRGGVGGCPSDRQKAAAPSVTASSRRAYHEAMSERRPEELAALREAGFHAVRHPASVDPPRWEAGERLVLWEYPAFQPAFSVSAFRVQPSSSAHVLRLVEWNHPHDGERLGQPMVGLREGFHATPTLAVHEEPIEEEMIDCWLGELREITVPVAVDAGGGLDGVACGLRAGWTPLFNSSELTWWGDGPPEWRALINWADEVRAALLDRCSR